MAIYSGIDGVVRRFSSIEAGRSSVIRSLPMMKCGIDGIIYDLLDITEQIDYAAIVLTSSEVCTIDYNGDYQSTDGYDMATLNQYGSVSVGTNYFQVTCTTRYKQLNVNYFIFIVFKDGYRAYIDDVLSSGGITYTLSVTGYEYFSDDGWYQNYCLGSEVLSGHVTNTKTATVSLSDVSSQCGGNIMASMRDSGTNTGRQTFNSININGTSFSVKVINELT